MLNIICYPFFISNLFTKISYTSILTRMGEYAHHRIITTSSLQKNNLTMLNASMPNAEKEIKENSKVTLYFH